MDDDFNAGWNACLNNIKDIPAADVVEEENILKFYYVRSIDEYWVGRRIDNFYYAEYDPKSHQWVWTHSRYLPWGEHVVSPTSLWKEHTYPSEPEEIPFEEWLQGFIKRYAADVQPVRRGKWIIVDQGDTACLVECDQCGMHYIVANDVFDEWLASENRNYCPKCGAYMREKNGEEI